MIPRATDDGLEAACRGVLTEGFFDSDGVRLHYIDWGGSGRPMLLLAGSAHLFRGLAPRLDERFRVRVVNA